MTLAESPAVRVAVSGRRIQARLLAIGPPGLEQAAELAFSAEDIRAAPPDLAAALFVYRDEVEVFAGHAIELRRRDTGEWRLTAMRAGAMLDRLSGGLGLSKGTDKVEVMQQIASSNESGFTKIRIFDWDPPAEPFAVVLPVEGAMESGTIKAGAVTITTNPSDAEKYEPIAPDDLYREFRGTSAWAVCFVHARTLFDAEQAGLRGAQRVIDRWALASRHSLAVSPNGEPRPFHRHMVREAIQLRPIADVAALNSNRAWLRGVRYTDDPRPARLDAIAGLAEAVSADDDRTDQVIAAWRRATVANAQREAVVALAEALEWYSQDARTPKRFDRHACRTIVRRATDGLTEDDAIHVKRLLEEGLNRVPLMDRVWAAIDADRVPITPEEAALLERIRDVRNRLLHGGRPVELPARGDLLWGSAVINRMLMFRLQRAHEQAASDDPPR